MLLQNSATIFDARDNMKVQLQRVGKSLQPLACFIDPERAPITDPESDTQQQTEETSTTPQELRTQKESFMLINDTKYVAESPLKAVNMGFKACNGLHADYPEYRSLERMIEAAIWREKGLGL